MVRFGQFFEAPLQMKPRLQPYATQAATLCGPGCNPMCPRHPLKWDASQREVKAIESEFQQAKQGDSARAAQLLWHLPREPRTTASAGATSARLLPAEAGTDVRRRWCASTGSIITN